MGVFTDSSVAPSPRASDDLSEPLFQDTHLKSAKSKLPWSWCYIFPWFLSVALFILLAVEKAKKLSKEPIFWKEYEFEGAKREITPTWKEVKFTGGLNIDSGRVVREIDPNQPSYVGTPTPEIDAAWEKLIQPLNLFITLDEAAAMGTHGMIVEPESGLYLAMPQVLHDLHCLNFIRKAFRIDHYPEEKNLTSLQTHTDHCIDALRQSLMCTSDMTIIRQYWSDEYHRILADFDNVHMCRDFDAVRQWSDGRNGQDEDVWPQVAEKLKGKKPAK